MVAFHYTASGVTPLNEQGRTRHARGQHALLLVIAVLPPVQEARRLRRKLENRGRRSGTEVGNGGRTWSKLIELRKKLPRPDDRRREGVVEAVDTVNTKPTCSSSSNQCEGSGCVFARWRSRSRRSLAGTEGPALMALPLHLRPSVAESIEGLAIDGRVHCTAGRRACRRQRRRGDFREAEAGARLVEKLPWTAAHAPKGWPLAADTTHTRSSAVLANT